MSNRIELLKLEFRKTLKQCEGYNDDRSLFARVYNNLVDAVKEFESFEVKNPIIKVAFSEQYNKEMNELKELRKSLFMRNMISDF